MAFIKTVFKELYGRFVKRKAQEFNVKNRAFKLLEKGNLPPAPGHFTELEALRKIMEANPKFKEEVLIKDDQLIDHMGQVKINVKYPVEPKKKKTRLPKDRHIIPKDTNFKVETVPVGCIDFEMFLKIYDYKYNHLWSNEEIADEFDLKLSDVDDLLFFFKPFNNKIVDKKRMLPVSDMRLKKTYLKIAELLKRDPENFKEIPLYKQELARIEKENQDIKEMEEEDEVTETLEEEYERVANMKFKEQPFFIANQASQKEKMNKEKKTDSKPEER